MLTRFYNRILMRLSPAGKSSSHQYSPIRNTEYEFQWPVISHSTLDSRMMNPGLDRPICNTLGLAIVGQKHITSTITRLSFTIGPPAVIWAVSLGIVDTI